MCGIIAAASNRNVGKLLVQGLHKMEYRGYDSAGIALHQEDGIAHLRTLGKVQLLEEKMIAEKPKSKLGIAHTRWATHGEPSEINAHPHKSQDSVYIVHNGIIENYSDLKKELLKKGYEFKSDTDSEVIAHLIDLNLKDSSHEEALKKTLTRLEGAFAIAILFKDQNFLVGARKVFHILHEVFFADKGQWFFYYQDSLMTTLLPESLFGTIAVMLTICAFIYWIILNIFITKILE